MNAVKCNRCGKFFLYEERHFTLRIEESKGSRGLGMRRPPFIGDLCEKCGKDFEKWMKEERENENEENIE